MTPEKIQERLKFLGIDPESYEGKLFIKFNSRSDEEIQAARAKAIPPKRVPPPGKTVWDMIVGTIPMEEGEDEEEFIRLVEEQVS